MPSYRSSINDGRSCFDGAWDTTTFAGTGAVRETLCSCCVTSSLVSPPARDANTRRARKLTSTESFQGPSETDRHGRPRCKNQDRLLEFVVRSKLLLNDRCLPPPGRNELDCVDPMLLAVKLMCSHFLFELEGVPHHVFGMGESQQAVYTASNHAKMFHGPTHTSVNMEWLSHCLNFFRYHMMSEDAQTLHGSISELSEVQKPSVWQEPLRTGAYPLVRHWKGTYAFLEASEVAKIRRIDPAKPCSEYFHDKNVDEGKIQVHSPTLRACEIRG